MLGKRMAGVVPRRVPLALERCVDICRVAWAIGSAITVCGFISSKRIYLVKRDRI